MTFKEFMHTPNPYLDKLALEAEIQRTIDDEAAYDARCMEAQIRKETKPMRHYIIHISKNNKPIANCRIEAANKTEAEALVTECKFADAGYTTAVTTVKKDKTKKVCTKEQLIAAIKRNEAAEKPMLPTKEDCKPAPSAGYAGNTDRSVDYKVYKVTKKQLDYLTYLLARYGDASKTPRQLTPAEVSKSIQILKARSIHSCGRCYSVTEKRKDLVKDQYLKNLYALINPVNDAGKEAKHRYKIVMTSWGGTHCDMFTDLSYEEAYEICESYGWQASPNDGYVWDLEIEEEV